MQQILVIAVAFFTLNGLSFSLASADTGYLLLSFSSYNIGGSYEWGIYLIGLLCWLQFLFSLAAIALGIISIFTKANVRKIIGMLILIGSVIFCFLYMLEGVIETAICNSNTSRGEYATTAFIPFLLNVVLAITYFVIPSLAKNAMGDVDYNHSGNIGNNGEYETSLNTPLVGEANESGVGQSAPSAKKDIDSILFYVKSYIPDEKAMSFRNALLKSNANNLEFINMVPLKNPTTVLLFSIFLGGLGVDRFYIGDTGLGVAKLLLSAFTFGIWPLVDIFMCYKKAKELNYNNLINKLSHRA